MSDESEEVGLFLNSNRSAIKWSFIGDIILSDGLKLLILLIIIQTLLNVFGKLTLFNKDINSF